MLRIYEQFAIEAAAMPVIAGRKSRLESFAGANCTYTIEAMMGDRRALQAGTSHNLGDNFARAFGTRYLDEAGELRFVHQSSWGVSTRLIGGIIMTHGDDTGLRLPPALAPVQVVIVPILKKGIEPQAVYGAARALEVALRGAGMRVQLDFSADKTPGWKFNHYEMKGVPLRVEVSGRCTGTPLPAACAILLSPITGLTLVLAFVADRPSRCGAGHLCHRASRRARQGGQAAGRPASSRSLCASGAEAAGRCAGGAAGAGHRIP